MSEKYDQFSLSDEVLSEAEAPDTVNVGQLPTPENDPDFESATRESLALLRRIYNLDIDDSEQTRTFPVYVSRKDDTFERHPLYSLNTQRTVDLNDAGQIKYTVWIDNVLKEETKDRVVFSDPIGEGGVSTAEVELGSIHTVRNALSKLKRAHPGTPHFIEEDE